jgi:predicted RNA binding protein YcfA (HicA-like mRNA interferase family)
MKPKQVCRRIERLGGVVIRQNGSHRTFLVRYGESGRLTTRVPMHPRELRKGTIHAIERDLEPALGKGWLTR